MYIMDLDEKMKKEQTRRVVIGREKFWITYSDVVLLTKSEKGLRGMLRRFKKYIERKGLILSTDKSKIMVSEVAKEREKRRIKVGRRKDKRGEKNEIFEIMQKIGGVKKYIMERIAAIANEEDVQHRGKASKKDFSGRMNIFETLVENIALYEEVIWEGETRLE